jgi:RimJ/RimL family protein N-acetyltransferase
MIALEPFTTGDIDRLIAWVPDETFLLQWAGPTLAWPLTREQFEREIKALTPHGPHRMYRAVKDLTTVGHIEIKSIDTKHANAMLGRILVAPSARGQGLGLPIVSEALRVCFGELKLHRVGLRVFTQNKIAIACYKRAGFVVEGNERHTKRAPDGTWWDACTMAILEDDWRGRSYSAA